MAAEPPDRFAREREVRAAFSPSAPIHRRDLFAGRIEQMMYVEEAIAEPGQHALIYGERGVGKTSLAAVSREMLDGCLPVRINCQASDDFSSVWRKVFGEIKFSTNDPGFGFTGPGEDTIVTAAEYFTEVERISPDNVRAALGTLGADLPLAIYIDEFDRLRVPVRKLFADTIKTLSDQIVPATVILVGVADDVDELVAEHRSIERALVQIHMPRMSRRELADIVVTGLSTVRMTASAEALSRITALSQGLPHYTHVLAQHAAGVAAWGDADEVRAPHVDTAVQMALTKSQESLNDDYYRATRSNREKNMYKQVVLACACARVDERGYFEAAAVREPLGRILGRPVGTRQFAPHLNALASDRGPILKKVGSATKFRYRFVKPIMQPYILMRGLADDVIGYETLEQLTRTP